MNEEVSKRTKFWEFIKLTEPILYLSLSLLEANNLYTYQKRKESEWVRKYTEERNKKKKKQIKQRRKRKTSMNQSIGREALSGTKRKGNAT